MSSPHLEFNYDISCPFAYIASTRINSLATRTNTTLTWRPVLLGAIYRATSAPQGAKGSASDVFNPTKRAVTSQSMKRTIRRYGIAYNPPPEHPRKTVNALRLLHVLKGAERGVVSKALFRAYWVEGRDVSDDQVLLGVVRECGVLSVDGKEITRESWMDSKARRDLEEATADACERGAFGVPGFWIPEARWVEANGESRTGRYFWGQDRMHFVEATLLSMQTSNNDGGNWQSVNGLKSLMPRCIPHDQLPSKTRLEFWYDFSSPWAFLGWTQIQRLQRSFGTNLEIVMKPFLLGILFREIGAPNLPSAAISPAKGKWSRQDHVDWTKFWNAVNGQEGKPDKEVEFYWADVFPIRTPTVLRVAIVEPQSVPVLYRGCWEENLDMAKDDVLVGVLDRAGFDGKELLRKANTPEVKAKLREATAEAKALGLCGVPSYRVLRQDGDGGWKCRDGIVWGQDELNVVEDLIAGWDPESSVAIAEPRKVKTGSVSGAKL